MLQNFLKIAWRNLLRHKAFSLINIGGLSIGIAACLLISLYVDYELSFDTYHLKKDRIFRVVNITRTPRKMITWLLHLHRISIIANFSFKQLRNRFYNRVEAQNLPAYGGVSGYYQS